MSDDKRGTSKSSRLKTGSNAQFSHSVSQSQPKWIINQMTFKNLAVVVSMNIERRFNSFLGFK